MEFADDLRRLCRLFSQNLREPKARILMPPFQAGSPIALCATVPNLSRLVEASVPLEVSDSEGSRHEIDPSDVPSIVHRGQHGPI